jgi:hypothetical protein
MQGFDPGFLFAHVEEVEPGDSSNAPIGIDLSLYQRGNRRSGCQGNVLQQLHVF